MLDVERSQITKPEPPMLSQPGLFIRERAQFHFGNLHGATIWTVEFGNQGEPWIPVVGDWDGTGTSKPGLYKREAAEFHLGDLSGATIKIVPFGNRGTDWIPVIGDWGDLRIAPRHSVLTTPFELKPHTGIDSANRMYFITF